MVNDNGGDLNKRDYAAYQVVKPITDAVGSVPIAGPMALDVVNLPCALGRLVDLHQSGICRAVSDTLGDLDAPAFPKGSPQKASPAR